MYVYMNSGEPLKAKMKWRQRRNGNINQFEEREGEECKKSKKECVPARERVGCGGQRDRLRERAPARESAVVDIVVYIYTCGLLSNGSGAVDFFDLTFVCAFLLLLRLLPG